MLPSSGRSTAGAVVVAVEIERPSKANHPKLVLLVMRLTAGLRAGLAAVARDAAVGAPPQRTCLRGRAARGRRAARGSGRAEAAALAASVAAEHRVLPRGGDSGRAW